MTDTEWLPEDFIVSRPDQYAVRLGPTLVGPFRHLSAAMDWIEAASTNPQAKKLGMCVVPLVPPYKGTVPTLTVKED